MVAADRTCVFHALTHIVWYDATKYSKINKHYAQWEQLNQDHNKAFWGLTKNLAGSKKKLAQSQGEFTNMQKEQIHLRIDLKLTEAQIKSLLADKAKLNS